MNTGITTKNFANQKNTSFAAILAQAQRGTAEFSQQQLQALSDYEARRLFGKSAYVGISKDGNYIVSLATQYAPEDIHVAVRDRTPVQVANLTPGIFSSKLSIFGADAILSGQIKSDSVMGDALVGLSDHLAALSGHGEIVATWPLTTQLSTPVLSEARPAKIIGGEVYVPERPKAIDGYHGVASSLRSDMTVQTYKGQNGFVEGAMKVNGEMVWSDLNKPLTANEISMVRDTYVTIQR